MNHDIKFWCPLTIQKATTVLDGKNTTVMRLGGIASTSDEDTDGEFLNPKGFDIKPFLTSGVVNWHHQAKGQPKTIIGEPSKAEIKKEGLYIETDLYPSSQIAKDVYELAETLEKDSKTRRLGYSIEGKVIKRKSNDKKSPDYKIIEKAVITGVAITHQPKNFQTFANIIKGVGVEAENEEEEDEEVVKKEMSTENSAAIVPEHVDKKLKQNLLSKAEVMDILFKDIPLLTIEKGEQIYKLLTKISAMSKRKNVTEEDIEKAYGALGIDVIEKSQTTTDIAEEAEKVEKGDDVEETEKVEKAKVDTEGGKKEDKDEDADVDSDGEEGNSKLTKGEGDEDEESSVEEKVEKGVSDETFESLTVKKFDSLEKAILTSATSSKELMKAVGVILKDVSGKLTKSEERELALTEIVKAQDETISGMSTALQEFGMRVQPRKSLTNAAVIEKSFGSENDIEKGEEVENTLSVSAQKGAVVELLDKATFEKGYDAEMSKACTSFESSGFLPAHIISKIKNSYGIQIVK